MRLLIYGFGPYKQFKENITEKILRRLPAKKGAKKVIFPVRFQKRQFIEAPKRHKPEVILGLGQTSRMRANWPVYARPVRRLCVAALGWRNEKPIASTCAGSNRGSETSPAGPCARRRPASSCLCHFDFFLLPAAYRLCHIERQCPISLS